MQIHKDPGFHHFFARKILEWNTKNNNNTYKNNNNNDYEYCLSHENIFFKGVEKCYFNVIKSL